MGNRPLKAVLMTVADSRGEFDRTAAEFGKDVPPQQFFNSIDGVIGDVVYDLWIEPV
jgi:hypothetical protein